MMYKKVYRKIIILLFFSFFFQNSFSNNLKSQVFIDNLDRSFVSALTGSPSSIPVSTEYGFILIQENRFLASYSKNGQCLWQRNLNSKIVNFTIGENEFIYAITSKNELVLVNPSGLILWKKPIGFSTNLCALEGFDSRIFVQGKNTLSCFGIGGIKKWSIKTENQSSLPMKKINDGSVIVFLEKLINGKSVAIRVSPFGEVIEEIVFQGKIINSFESNEGLMVVFSTGELGMFSIKNEKKGMSYSKWLNKDIVCTKDSKCIKINNSQYAIITPTKELSVINCSTGIKQTSFSIAEIKNNLLTIDFLDNKYILSDFEKTIVFYSTGKKYKHFIHPEKTGKYNWNYMTFTDAGFLIYFSNDWTINSFKIISTSKEKNNYNFLTYKKNLKNYNNFFELENYVPDGSYFSNKILETLKSGDYSTKEIDFSKNIISGINSYVFEKNSIQTNLDSTNLIKIEYSPIDLENLISIVPYFQTSQMSEYLAQLLSVETDKTLIIKILQGISQCGYDPSGEILLEIERLIKNSNPNDKLILSSAVDCVYEICRFMGRPAFVSKGKNILTNLFYPQYDESTKKSVRQVMQKLADLKM